MDGIRELLEAARDGGLVSGHLRGLMHIAIGRRVARADGSVISTGITWRELAALLKNLRFDKDLVRELGADPETLAPRDRQRFWYSAIALARVDSREAMLAAEALADPLKKLGFVIGPAPTVLPPTATKAKPKKDEPEEKPAKRKKKS